MIALLPLLLTSVQVPDDLPDFSRAGYHAGADPLPVEAESGRSIFPVTDFGAKPGDDLDDGPGIQRAIYAAGDAGGGVVEIPAGSWLLDSRVWIRNDNVVLRGAGSSLTKLRCLRPLAEIIGPNKNWSWSGGLIKVEPAKAPRKQVGKVSGIYDRDATSFALDLNPSVDPPQPGEWLELRWYNDTGQDTLLLEMHGGYLPRSKMGEELQESSSPRVKAWIQVKSFDEGRVTIDAPLRLPLRPEWACTLTRSPTIRESGVEGLSLIFPETDYPGHLNERGYNGIGMGNAIDCWVRDFKTLNADSGILVGSSKRITIQDVTLVGRYMHHPLSLSWSTDCLVQDWRIEAQHRHGTTLSWSSHGNVFRGGYGVDLAMDSHRAASFENLHENIVIEVTGKPLQPLRSGGSSPRGPHAGTRNIYWNVELRFPADAVDPKLKITGLEEWPGGIFAGWRSSSGEVTLVAKPSLGHQVLYPGEELPAYPKQ